MLVSISGSVSLAHPREATLKDDRSIPDPQYCLDTPTEGEPASVSLAYQAPLEGKPLALAFALGGPSPEHAINRPRRGL